MMPRPPSDMLGVREHREVGWLRSAIFLVEEAIFRVSRGLDLVMRDIDSLC